MKKSEMFDLMVDEVSRVCEVGREHIIKGRRLQPIVDARILVVQYLFRAGLGADDVALCIAREEKGDPDYCPPLDELKSRSRTLNKRFNSYSKRCLESHIFRVMSSEVAEFYKKVLTESHISSM